MARLIRYLRPYSGAVAGALVCLLIHSLLQVAGPLLTKLAVDGYFSGPGAARPEFLPADPARGLWMISGAFFVVLICSMLAEYGQTWLMQWTGQRAMFDLRRDLMARLQALDLPFFDANPVGRLVTRVTTDVDTLNELFTSGIVTIAGDLLMLGFVAFTMYRLSPGLTLILLAALPFVVLTAGLFRRAVAKSNRRIRVALARINSHLQEHVTGMAVVQLMNREKRAVGEFEAVNRDHMEAYRDSIRAYGWFYPVVEFFSMLALAGMLAWGGAQVGSGGVSLGVLVAFFQYGVRFFRPIGDLSEKYNILQSAMAASERVFKLLDTEPHVVRAAAPRPFVPGAIEFDHVWFAYQGEDWVLRDVTFRIEPGETVAVVGHTGAGKTTLTNLLLRFYDVQRGAIRIGGIDIRELAVEDVRRHFGIVLQDPFLFTGTLRENVGLGVAAEETVREAARRVSLLPFVESLPEGFGHTIRERGQGLSTGQKQLIGFARALALNPAVLILDEATSSVDTETEMQIRSALEVLMTGRTALVIAHRLSTVQSAHRILVMHKGELREAGTHQELLALRGVYYRLFQLQYQDQERRPA